MWQTLGLGFLIGILGGNALPHLVKGIVRERYPCLFGNGPLPNLVAGWTLAAITALVAHAAPLSRAPLAAAVGVALGVLGIGLFHAGPGAFGRPD